MQLPRMPKSPQQEEPIGIVIADGGRSDASPRFSAFVWGPVPSDLDERVETLAVAATA